MSKLSYRQLIEQSIAKMEEQTGEPPTTIVMHPDLLPILRRHVEELGLHVDLDPDAPNGCLYLKTEYVDLSGGEG